MSFIRGVLLFFPVLFAFAVFGQQSDEGKGVRLCGMVWVDSSAIESRLDIKTLVLNSKNAGIGTLIVVVKPESGRIYWRSAAFRDATAKVVESFDPLAKLLDEAHRAGLKVHAALCALRENAETSVPFKKHPEWAMRDAEEKTTGRMVWMCPARRDGYVRKWLLPLTEELLKNYDIDGLHLYGLSYPVSSDAFCFCDWCLEEVRRWASLEGSSSAEKPADWRERTGPKSAWWESASRKKKAEYLLKGSSLPDGRVSDMDFFFYDYRCAAIKRVVEGVFALVRRIKPDTFFSVSVFDSPEKAARFVGQRWTEWAHYLDFIVVDASRRRQTAYDEYLESLRKFSKVKERLEGRTHAYASIAVEALYREVFDALDGMESCLDRIGESEGKKVYEELERHYSVVAESLKGSDAGAMKEMDAALMRLKRAVEKGSSDEEALALIKKQITRLRNSPPEGFFQLKSLRDALSAAAGSGADGVVLASADTLDRFGFWKPLSDLFKGSVSETFRTHPLTDCPCIGALRGLRTAEKVIHSLKLRIDESEKEVGTLKEQLKQSRANERKAQEEAKVLAAKLKGLQDRMAELRERLGESEDEVKRLREEMERERSISAILKKKFEEELEKEKEKRRSVEDEMKAVQVELKRVQTEVREHLLRLTEDARRQDEESERERLTVVAALMVAAAVFAIALILSIALRRRRPGEE